MEYIPIERLLINQRTTELYSPEGNGGRLVKSIQLFGILEPLKVYRVDKSGMFQVISGNRRLIAAQELGLLEVPCIIVEPIVIVDDLIFAHQEQRVKKRSEILLELNALYEKYGKYLKQGKKSETAEVIEARRFRDELHVEIGGKHVSRHYRIYENRARELSKGSEEVYKKEIESLNRAKSLSGALKSQENRLAKAINEKSSSDFKFEIIPNAEVKVASSNKLIGIEDESVNLIFTSPPYFQMRNYGNGKAELGQESTVNDFIQNLANHFDDCKRVLAKDGTLWVTSKFGSRVMHNGKICPALFLCTSTSTFLRRVLLLSSTIGGQASILVKRVVGLPTAKREVV